MKKSETDQSRTSGSPLWKRRIVLIPAGILIFLVLLIQVIVPFGARKYLEKWLVENGADRASIEKVQINPFTGTAALEGVAVEKNGKTVLANSTMYFNIGLRNLLSRDALIQQATLADVIIDIEKTADETLRIGSYSIAPAAAEIVEKADGADDTLEETIPWLFHAQTVGLNNVTISYRQPDLSLELVIEEALLKTIDNDPNNEKGFLRLKGSLNGAALELDFPVFSVLPGQDITGNIALSGIKLDDFEQVLDDYLTQLQGVANIDGRISFAMPPGLEKLDLQFDGDIALENGAIASDSWATETTVAYQGTGTFAMNGKEMRVELDGRLTGSNSSFTMPEPAMALANSDIAISGKTAVSITEELTVDTNASLDLAPTTFSTDALDSAAGTTTWNGTVQVQTGTDVKEFVARAEGELDVAAPSYAMDADGGRMEAGNDRLHWNGSLEYVQQPGSGGTAVELDGRLTGSNNSFTMPEPLIALTNGDIAVSGKTAVSITEELTVDTNASLDLAPTTFSMDALDSATGTTAWKGTVQVQTGTDVKEFVARAEGELDVATPSYAMDADGGRMEAGNDRLNWNGSLEYVQQPGSGGAAALRTEGTLSGREFSLMLPGTIQITQKELSSNGSSDVSIGQDVGVVYQGDISFSGTGVELEGLSLGENWLHWSGKTDLQLGASARSLSMSGDLEGEGLFADLKESGVGITQERLSVSPDFSLVMEASPSFSGTLSLEATGLGLFNTDTPLLRLEKISVSGVRDDGSGGILSESLSLGELAIPASNYSPVDISIASITLAEIASPELTGLSAARLDIVKPQIKDDQNKIQLAGLDTLSFDTIQLNEDLSLSIDQVGTSNAVFLKPDGAEPQATLKEFSARQLQYSPERGVSLDTVDLDSLFATIVREKTGEPATEQAEDEQNTPEPGPVDQPESEGKAAGIQVKINQIRVSGSSGLKFTDKTVPDLFTTRLDLESLQVNDIDLNEPEQPFSYRLAGTFDKYSTIAVEGSIAPLADDLFIDQQLELKNYSMLYLSPYVIAAIGTYFPEGRLDVSSTLKLQDKVIDMENNLVIKDLTTKTVNDERAKELDNQLPVPLDLALSMLRDKEGTIDLDVPIDGPLSSLDVGLGDIIFTALSKGISTAVTPYLAYIALGPTGALIFAGSKLGGSLLKSDLPSLEFEPGTTALTQDQMALLDTVATAMEKDPDQSYSVCARVSSAELEHVDLDASVNQDPLQNEAVRKELFQLGESRALAVRDYLTSSHQIEEKRLSICNPGINFEKGEKTVVDFRK